MAKVKVPVLGEVDSRLLWVGGAAVAAIVAYAYWKRSQSTATTYDTTTGSTATYGYTNPVSITRDESVDTTTDSESIDTDSEWVQYAIEQMASAGYETAYVAGILGRYIDNQEITSEESDVVRGAWALAGRYDFLPAIRTGDDSSTPTDDEDAEYPLGLIGIFRNAASGAIYEFINNTRRWISPEEWATRTDRSYANVDPSSLIWDVPTTGYDPAPETESEDVPDGYYRKPNGAIYQVTGGYARWIDAPEWKTIVEKAGVKDQKLLYYQLPAYDHPFYDLPTL